MSMWKLKKHNWKETDQVTTVGLVCWTLEESGKEKLIKLFPPFLLFTINLFSWMSPFHFWNRSSEYPIRVEMKVPFTNLDFWRNLKLTNSLCNLWVLQFLCTYAFLCTIHLLTLPNTQHFHGQITFLILVTITLGDLSHYSHSVFWNSPFVDNQNSCQLSTCAPRYTGSFPTWINMA